MRTRWLLATVLLVLAGCASIRYGDRLGGMEPRVEPRTPEGTEVAGVVYLIGDAGNALEGRAPLLLQMAREVEHWSSVLSTDSAVVVLFLGDNVYELGVHAEDHADFAEDVSKLTSQVAVVAGAEATANRSLGLFVPGNHDWGNLAGPEGVQLLNNMDGQLAVHRADSTFVELIPDPGEPGPTLVDTPAARFVILDTHWWLQAGPSVRKDSVIAAIGRILDEDVDRPIVMVGHHPLHTGGPHGGLVALGSGLGLRYLANRAGALIQDLSSAPYSELIRRLRSAFDQHAPPLVYAAGHEHTLQVFSDTLPSGSSYAHLVSGAGSNVDLIGPADGLEWAAAAPGYMRLMFLRDGGVVLHAFTSDEDHLLCPGPDEEGHRACMDEGVAAVNLEYELRIR